MNAAPRRGSTWQWSRLRPHDRSLTGWFWWSIAYVAAPALAALMLFTGAFQIADAWSAAHGGGQLGKLHVTSRSCGVGRVGGYRCTGLYGEYTSADGSTHLPHAFLDGIPDHADIGTDVPVRYLGERGQTIVYTASGSREWPLIAGLMLVAVITLAVVVANVFARAHGRYLPWMAKPWTKPAVLREQRAPDKTGHLGRRRKRQPRR